MNDSAYQFEHQLYTSSPEQPILAVYRFESVSSIKTVQKYVVLNLTGEEFTANLALVDELDDGSLSDTISTNNGDMSVVLATVVQIIVHFLRHHPELSVMFTGSDYRRTYLYNTILNRRFDEFSVHFLLYGSSQGEIELFRLGKHYEKFYVRLNTK